MTGLEMEWYTIPEFAEAEPRCLYHKENQEAEDASPAEGMQNLHVLARAGIAYAAGDGIVRLRISADDYYKLYVNGVFAGQGPAPGYPEQYYFNELDITPLLVEGWNVLAVHLYYQGLVNRVWNSGDGRFGVACEICRGERRNERMLQVRDEQIQGELSRCKKQQVPGQRSLQGELQVPGQRSLQRELRVPGQRSLQGELRVPENRQQQCDLGEMYEPGGPQAAPELQGVRHQHEIPVWRYQISTAYEGEPTGYDTQFLENFDSRCWEEDWTDPEYDDSAWKEMVRMRHADYQMVPEPARQLVVYELQPQTIRKESSVWMLDLGREVTGGLRLRARGRSGSRVTIRMGEELAEDGSVRWQMRCGCRYEEVWTLRDGECSYESYDYKGFRYVQLQFEDDVELLQAAAVVRHYPLEEQLCTLNCSAPYVQDIFEICKNAVKCATQEGYLDCPTREKGQYLGDAFVTAHAQVWLGGTTELLRKCISQFAQTAQICPGLMAVAPGSFMQEIADFSLLWLELLWLDYQFTGDCTFLAKYYPAAKQVLAYFQKYERADGLLEQVAEKWNLVDWPENLRDGYDFELSRPVVAPGCHNVINALYVGVVGTLGKIERLLGIPVSYSFEERKQSYVRAFYDRETGLFRDSETSSHTALHSNVYALYFDLCPVDGRERIADFLQKKGLCCGVLVSYFYLKALARCGRQGEVYRVLVNESEHGWVNMLREGATACMEAWGKDQKWNTSLCHPWASAPIPVLIEDIAGFQPDPEAAEGFRFCPHIPKEAGTFTLNVPFRGRRYVIRTFSENDPPFLESGEGQEY